MQELGSAINESLSESERIADAIGEIRKAGYDVFLVLEATIGLNRREHEADGEDFEDGPGEFDLSLSADSLVGKMKLSAQDQKFLRALKIAVDDQDR